MATVQEIYNEIDRIDNAKSGIAGAIEEKGVEVPAGSKIEEYPGLVRQIQQGATLVSFVSDTNLVVVPGKQNERKTVNLLISYAYYDGNDTSYHLSILSFATSALDNPAPIRQILRNDLTEIGSWLVGKITATGEIFVYPTDLNSGDVKVYIYDMDGIQLELRSDEDEGYPTNADFNDAISSVDDKICDSVKFSSQTLSDAQKLQARENIGAQKDVNIQRISWIGKNYFCVSAGAHIGYSVRVDIDYESGGVGTLILTNKGDALSAYYYGDTLSSKIAAVSLYTDDNGAKWFVLEAASTPAGYTCLVTPFRGAVTAKTESDISAWTKSYDADVVELGAGGGGARGVFVATYGSTTVEQIRNAWGNGLFVVVKDSDQYVYVPNYAADDGDGTYPSYFVSYSPDEGIARYCFVDADDEWSKSSCVDAKRGIISQTQTWSGSGSNPRTYTIDPASIVRGLIPQSNIDIFEAAGAVFNESTGYFELNGLTDISYEEMKAIYNSTIGGVSLPATNRTNFLYQARCRTNIPVTPITGLDKSITRLASRCELEVFAYNNLFNYELCSQNTVEIAANSYKLRKIVGAAIRMGNNTGVNNNFNNAYSLEDVNVTNLAANISIAQSPNFSLASIVYMVQNAANTSAITITIHATAYARCQADTTEYTYGGNTYTGIIAYANARNITIASA